MDIFYGNLFHGDLTLHFLLISEIEHFSFVLYRDFLKYLLKELAHFLLGGLFH